MIKKEKTMARTLSTMLSLGTSAPTFALTDAHGKTVSLEDLGSAPATLVVFMCNHCPFVKHLIDPLVDLIKEYQAKGVAVAAINSNDVANYPDDRPELMAREAEQRGFTFPYLYDEDQSVAKAYRAACTPDFFVFDASLKLAYRGQMDDSRPDSGIPVTGADLRHALDAVLAGKKPAADQKPSLGCNIKWKAGNEPEYF
jgi:peroxiredoxin